MLLATAAVVPTAPERVFALLADLDRHHTLTDGRLEIVRLDGPPGRRSGGRVRLNGPLGIRRMAATRIEDAAFPESLTGTASLGLGTQAQLRWTLMAAHSGTYARLEVRLVRATLLDRLLLALGGRWWLRRRIDSAARALVRQFATGGGPQAR